MNWVIYDTAQEKWPCIPERPSKSAVLRFPRVFEGVFEVTVTSTPVRARVQRLRVCWTVEEEDVPANVQLNTRTSIWFMPALNTPDVRAYESLLSERLAVAAERDVLDAIGCGRAFPVPEDRTLMKRWLFQFQPMGPFALEAAEYARQWSRLNP
jgi:hypothetical protein